LCHHHDVVQMEEDGGLQQDYLKREINIKELRSSESDVLTAVVVLPAEKTFGKIRKYSGRSCKNRIVI